MHLIARIQYARKNSKVSNRESDWLQFFVISYQRQGEQHSIDVKKQNNGWQNLSKCFVGLSLSSRDCVTTRPLAKSYNGPKSETSTSLVIAFNR